MLDVLNEYYFGFTFEQKAKGLFSNGNKEDF